MLISGSAAWAQTTTADRESTDDRKGRDKGRGELRENHDGPAATDDRKGLAPIGARGTARTTTADRQPTDHRKGLAPIGARGTARTTTADRQRTDDRKGLAPIGARGTARTTTADRQPTDHRKGLGAIGARGTAQEKAGAGADHRPPQWWNDVAFARSCVSGCGCVRNCGSSVPR
ncbi:hypothetical protein Sm713_02730 [Streptomyces sp. TS71-3]|nr:hypothetical protein Sm713_02730 [Streptomyces sp. TS71-3]